ncbi:TIGR02391 family protein [Hymenobacter fodinae]|uniref:TIGR02391 family protein n=1 Tax=Hymenobacter fodinae TaxID=2510796 RepID=A0A4Z0PBX3_9BACT|nr:TIGR02391 family protein [Hymenobacter fodinae]TGE09721.1 TIGR02391 family protein [Hymenobacter fodinae]
MNFQITKDCKGIIDRLVSEENLSKVFPSALVLSKKIKDPHLEKWVNLEFNGYFKGNSYMDNDVVVPEYRSLPGQYLNDYGQIMRIDNPDLKFANEYRLRNGIAELEEFAKASTMITLSDSSFNSLIRQNLGFDASRFQFAPYSVVGILNDIKSSLINKLTDLIDHQEELQRNDVQTLSNIIPLLHTSVQSAVGNLYSNGHYRQAILDTYIHLVDYVKRKSNRSDLDGSQLMDNVFSPRNPVLKLSEDENERQGYMLLFKGAVMAIRNPKAHSLIEQNDPQKTLEWLSFASVLFRKVDEAELVVRN